MSTRWNFFVGEAEEFEKVDPKNLYLCPTYECLLLPPPRVCVRFHQ